MHLIELARHRVDDIVLLNSRICEFWQDGGWAPRDAAELLQEAKLDWQIELSRTLSLWLDPGPPGEQQARLILAWANLGTLVEGTLKWFLCVYRNDYGTNPLLKRFGPQKGQLIEPPEAMLNELIQYFSSNVWTERQEREWYDWCREVQQRRNAIHAFEDHNLGTHEELLEGVCAYKEFLWDINTSLPYPDVPEDGPAAPYELTDTLFWIRRDEGRGIPTNRLAWRTRCR